MDLHLIVLGQCQTIRIVGNAIASGQEFFIQRGYSRAEESKLSLVNASI